MMPAIERDSDEAWDERATDASRSILIPDAMQPALYMKAATVAAGLVALRALCAWVPALY
jgi:hypothetical protein